jgi:hypothetical protein
MREVDRYAGKCNNHSLLSVYSLLSHSLLSLPYLSFSFLSLPFLSLPYFTHPSLLFPSLFFCVDVCSCSEAVGTSATVEEAAAMSTEDARCVLCLVSMSFSHSHVVYPQLSVYVLMFVHVVKLSAHLPLWRKLRRCARRMLGVYYVLCQCLSHRLLLFFVSSVFYYSLPVID